jgi:hypothetical protein
MFTASALYTGGSCSHSMRTARTRSASSIACASRRRVKLRRSTPYKSASGSRPSKVLTIFHPSILLAFVLPVGAAPGLFRV